ncbi:arylsulfatase J isoform X2 [Dendroctonus ponderosae]|uniref:arylsulfatase J isoform X2 n=1 Tax=Dendroctonus ponderosae TaxID=77166 RepID=UPI002034D307|nr:arylsulfatase J isoform X2 [Dendroctonus ponderosae]
MLALKTILIGLVWPAFVFSSETRPNIVLIIADDLGFNDVGFHGSGEIPTPNIDALAYSGLILDNYYVTPICTPSRSALMTGKYPIHTGMQHAVLYGAEPRGLPLTEKILPQYLEELGYVNHIVGKWHLGSWKKEYTPLYRGFISHLGYWTGHQDYFDHTAVENPGWGLDMRRNMSIAYDLHGQYSTDLFTEESVRLINEHNTEKPLFLYLAHAAVHSGNPYEPLRAPDDEVDKFEYIQESQRQRFAAMLSKLDQSVGAVVKALKNRNMLENSIVIFTSDNGGPAAGFNLNAASNYPLKGVKNTLWEGTTYNGQWDNWYGPSGRDAQYNISLVQNSPTGKALQEINASTSAEVIKSLRNAATIDCKNVSQIECNPVDAPCLFNIASDPCEYANLATDYPLILQQLQKKLQQYNATAIPPRNLPLDERGNPKYWNYVFTNFGDYETPLVVVN